MPENSKSNVNPVRGADLKVLAETGNKKASNGVKKVLPVLVLTTTFYYSYLLCIGLILGYLACKLYHKKFIESGKIDLIFIDCGKWEIHLHHWIMGAALLLIVWVVDFLYLPSFFVGAVAGVIAHDIYDFDDWHQILIKKETCKIKK